MKKLIVVVLLAQSFVSMYAMEESPKAGARENLGQLKNAVVQEFLKHANLYVLDANQESLTALEDCLRQGVRLSSKINGNGSVVADVLVLLENDLRNAERNKNSFDAFAHHYLTAHQIESMDTAELRLIFESMVHGVDQKNRLAEVRQKAAAYDLPESERQGRKIDQSDAVRRSSGTKSRWALRKVAGGLLLIAGILYLSKKAYNAYTSPHENEETN